MRAVFVPPEGAGWLCHKVQYIPTPAMVCLAVLNDDNEIMGMVGLDAWTNNSVQAHICIEDVRCTRLLLRSSFQYCFDNDRNVVVGVTPGDLPRAEKFMKGIGFKEICRIKDGNAQGVDTIISEVRAETCRWAKPKQQRQAA